MNLPSVIWKSTDYSLASPKTLWLSLIWNTRTLNPCDSVTSHGAMTPVLHSHPTRSCVFYGYYHAEAFATPACKWWLGPGLWKSLTTAVNQTWFLLLYCISLGKNIIFFFIEIASSMQKNGMVDADQQLGGWHLQFQRKASLRRVRSRGEDLEG